MPSGTVINEVFSPRIHKSNAEDVLEQSRDMIDWASRRLLVLAASTPTAEEKEMLVTEVEELVEELVDSSWRAWAADYIISNPEKCIDDLDDLDDQSIGWS